MWASPSMAMATVCSWWTPAAKSSTGDQLLFIIAQHRADQGVLQGGVVGTVMTNFGLERALEERNIPFCRASVGDRYVLEKLKMQGWQLGGESSGHILCLDLATTGDAIVAALQALVPMVESGLSLTELKRGMTKLPQVMINVRTEDPGRAPLVRICATRPIGQPRALRPWPRADTPFRH